MFFVGLSFWSCVRKIKKINSEENVTGDESLKVKKIGQVNGKGRHSNLQEKYVKSLREASVAFWRSYR